jgi:AbrB family looped-hinge helix DNA binding protein
MKVTSKGQVTIPLEVRRSMGISPAETEVDFKQDDKGRWYLSKAKRRDNGTSRFRRAHSAGKLRMSTEEIMALSRTD